MISKAFITEWRKYAPWILDNQVEHDLILSRLLIELFSNEIISSSLSLRGGTALYKVFVKRKSVRFSEDIDLVQKENKPIGEVMSAIRTVCDPLLGIPKYKQTKGRVTFYYSADSELPPIVPLKFKIEINTREHYILYGQENIEYEMNSRWFKGSTIIKTYSLDELLGTKLRALYQRKKGRDLFDIWYLLRNHNYNIEKVINSFHFYIEKQNLHISKREFINNLTKKLDDRQFLLDTKNILNPEIKFDYSEAYNYIKEKLLNFL